MEEVIILFGGNLGSPTKTIEQAIKKLSNKGLMEVKSSSFYKTKAWGKTDQPDFINSVTMFRTNILPHEVLRICLQTEEELGRVRFEKWGERLIDIDILFYNNQTINDSQLTVPHPYLHERRFTLAPLAEISPNYIHPTLQKTIKELLDSCPDTLEVLKL